MPTAVAEQRPVSRPVTFVTFTAMERGGPRRFNWDGDSYDGMEAIEAWMDQHGILAVDVKRGDRYHCAIVSLRKK